jgi:hypothetical protein
MYRIIKIAIGFHSIEPKYRPMFTSFSTSELCGTDEETKSASFDSKGRSREFLGTFFGKKCLPLPGMRAGKAVLKRHLAIGLK